VQGLEVRSYWDKKSCLLIGAIDSMTDRGHAICMFPIHQIKLHYVTES
jgi:hypothetical protein